MPETKLESRTPRAADTAQPQPKSHGLALKDRRQLGVAGGLRRGGMYYGASGSAACSGPRGMLCGWHSGRGRCGAFSGT